MSAITDNLERLLAAGPDTPLLRFSLGNAYLNTDPARAASHLTHAVELDPNYSAAWKLLGKALQAAGRLDEARAAFSQGIVVAQGKGDIQAAKEMKVFLKRISG